MNCETCKARLVAYYQLNRIEASGATQGTVDVCSIICLVKWAYTYGAQRTTMGVMMAKHVIGSALSSLRGTPPNLR